jgi:hypothetical protein
LRCKPWPEPLFPIIQVFICCLSSGLAFFRHSFENSGKPGRFMPLWQTYTGVVLNGRVRNHGDDEQRKEKKSTSDGQKNSFSVNFPVCKNEKKIFFSYLLQKVLVFFMIVYLLFSDDGVFLCVCVFCIFARARALQVGSYYLFMIVVCLLVL